MLMSMQLQYAMRLAAALVATAATARGTLPHRLDMPLMKQVTPDYGENQAISPFLITSALSQVWVGAGGTTHSELGDRLGITGVEQLYHSYRSTNRALSTPSPGTTTAVFNRVYVREKFSVKRSFILFLRIIFGVDVKQFSNVAQAVTAINTDVAAVTKDRINNLVDESALQTTLIVLVSALYFKGMWLQHFKPIGDRTFSTASGDRQVPMMSLTSKLQYVKLKDFDVVALPYKHPHYSMLIFRPDSRSEGRVKFLHAALASIDVTAIYRQLSGTSKLLTVTMPKFKIESNYELKGDLQALGVRQLFSSAADLSGISPAHLSVNEVIHQVFLEVNEEGTEAAGAVAVFLTRSARGPRPLPFVVDRPFLAVLYHNKQHANLFSAWVANPKV